MQLPARLASGAQQSGEHAQVFIYAIARALDTDGSGRVAVLDVARELRLAYRGNRIARWLEHEKSARYWTVDRQYLRIHGIVKVLESFECELPDNDFGIQLSTRWLDTRSRRGAALLAAVLAGMEMPRSRDFIWKFTRVDRKTISAWRRDRIVGTQILRSMPQWATI